MRRYHRALSESLPSDAVRPLRRTGAVTECHTPDPAASFGAMGALRATRRRRRLGDVVWGDLAYRVYTTALASLVLVIFASGFVGDRELSPSSVATVAADGPAWVGLFVASVMVLGLRSGLRSGPVALEGADVHHLLLAPVDRSAVLRRPVAGLVGYGGVGAALLGALIGALCAQRLPGPSSSWVLSGALFGLTCATLTLGTGLVTASRRVRRPILDLAVAALWLWSMLDALDVVPHAPLSYVASMLLWPLEAEPVALAGTLVGVVLVVAGTAIVGGLSIEAARRRTQMVGQLRFAVTQQDLRSVLLLRRQLAAERPRNRPRMSRLPRFVGRFPVFARDLQSLLRWPTVRIVRVLVLCIGAALALRGVWDGTTPLVLVAGIAGYVAALDAIEPLAQEIDHPTMLQSYPVAQGMVLVRHLVAPVLVLLLAGAAALAVAWSIGPSVEALTVGGITLISASVAAVAGAAISVVSEAVLDQTGEAMMPPEVAGPRVVVRTLWPPLVAVIGTLPVLAAQRVMRDGGAVEPVAAAVAGASLALSAIVFTWVRYRADLHRAMGQAMRGETGGGVS